MYPSSISCFIWKRYLHIDFVVVDECDSEWDIIFTALLLQLVCDVDGIYR